LVNPPISVTAVLSKIPAIVVPVLVPLAVHTVGTTVLFPVSAAYSTVPTLFAPLVRSRRNLNQYQVASTKGVVGVTIIEVTAVPSTEAVSPIVPVVEI
jgi:hypothetical protein